MQQTEAKRYQPWIVSRYDAAPAFVAHQLAGKKYDGECNRSLDRRGWHSDETESCRRQRDAVRQRERGDRGEKLAEPPYQQKQTQHEQQVIDAEQDMLDPEPDMAAQHHQRSWLFRHDEARIGGCQAGSANAAVRGLYSDQHVGQGAVEPTDRDPLPF